MDKFVDGVTVDLLTSRLNRSIAASATMMFVKSVFHRWPGGKELAFQMNPGSVALYSILEDSVDSTLVYARGVIANLGIQDHIHGWSALSCHRHIISHPDQQIYAQAAVQRFFEEDQHELDPKIQRLWGVLVSAIDWAEANSLSCQPGQRPRIQATTDMVDAAWSILRLSLKQPNILTWEAVREKVLEWFPKWQVSIEDIYQAERASGVLYGVLQAEKRRTKKM